MRYKSPVLGIAALVFIVLVGCDQPKEIKEVEAVKSPWDTPMVQQTPVVVTSPSPTPILAPTPSLPKSVPATIRDIVPEDHDDKMSGTVTQDGNKLTVLYSLIWDCNGGVQAQGELQTEMIIDLDAKTWSSHDRYPHGDCTTTDLESEWNELDQPKDQPFTINKSGNETVIEAQNTEDGKVFQTIIVKY